jgi:hypothetical protein
MGQALGAALAVLLTTAPAVSPEARAALIEETTAIWAHSGVRLEWLDPGGPPRGGRRLRLLAVERPSLDPPAGAVILGELLRFETGAIAMVSLHEAAGVVERVRLRHGITPRFGETAVGRVLGRAAAHEIGHYLLNSPTHAAHGLMRARFDSLEFADHRSDVFHLDDEAAGWVRRRLAGDTNLATFSYPVQLADVQQAEKTLTVSR